MQGPGTSARSTAVHDVLLRGLSQALLRGPAGHPLRIPLPQLAWDSLPRQHPLFMCSVVVQKSLLSLDFGFPNGTLKDVTE